MQQSFPVWLVFLISCRDRLDLNPSSGEVKEEGKDLFDQEEGIGHFCACFVDRVNAKCENVEVQWLAWLEHFYVVGGDLAHVDLATYEAVQRVLFDWDEGGKAYYPIGCIAQNKECFWILLQPAKIDFFYPAKISFLLFIGVEGPLVDVCYCRYIFGGCEREKGWKLLLVLTEDVARG